MFKKIGHAIKHRYDKVKESIKHPSHKDWRDEMLSVITLKDITGMSPRYLPGDSKRVYSNSYWELRYSRSTKSFYYGDRIGLDTTRFYKISRKYAEQCIGKEESRTLNELVDAYVPGA